MFEGDTLIRINWQTYFCNKQYSNGYISIIFHFWAYASKSQDVFKVKKDGFFESHWSKNYLVIFTKFEGICTCTVEEELQKASLRMRDF